MEEAREEENNMPRRSLRLALSEINNETAVDYNQNTPNKSASAEEILVIQRGPRRKPLTWSPVEYDRTKILAPSRDKTPDPSPPAKPEIMNSKLRRRLIMSPGKNPSQDLGVVIAKKLRSIKSFERANKTS